MTDIRENKLAAAIAALDSILLKNKPAKHEPLFILCLQCGFLFVVNNTKNSINLGNG
jgi:hypothetical protein